MFLWVQCWDDVIVDTNTCSPGWAERHYPLAAELCHCQESTWKLFYRRLDESRVMDQLKQARWITAESVRDSVHCALAAGGRNIGGVDPSPRSTYGAMVKIGSQQVALALYRMLNYQVGTELPSYDELKATSTFSFYPGPRLGLRTSLVPRATQPPTSAIPIVITGQLGPTFNLVHTELPGHPVDFYDSHATLCSSYRRNERDMAYPLSNQHHTHKAQRKSA
ncbi:hypothetical protein T440DRAFT_483602 [Plenodomus tracheiphilus IPT5]|uniref:Uncharacterized protein n=1 Tax=Plenodomus tracheiphilus IPT5 TaxID=1408161 RepID=A0A6A7APJ4_9PLEO|nr:hypothetical protein T440DRAFT_483602 [Plenodomus tracheiphilus IPT5]